VRTAIVLASGLSASGKTTLSRELGAALDPPVRERNRLKDLMLDHIPADSLAANKRVGAASWELLFDLMPRFAATGSAFMVDARGRSTSGTRPPATTSASPTSARTFVDPAMHEDAVSYPGDGPGAGHRQTGHAPGDRGMAPTPQLIAAAGVGVMSGRRAPPAARFTSNESADLTRFHGSRRIARAHRRAGEGSGRRPQARAPGRTWGFRPDGPQRGHAQPASAAGRQPTNPEAVRITTARHTTDHRDVPVPDG
jgi:hypothetical protein